MEANDIRINNWVSHNSNWCYRGENVTEFQWTESDWYALGECTMFLEDIEPIEITNEWLLKLSFENWGYGKLYTTEHEKYTRYVLHNVLDGTSNFEVHFIESNYGGEIHTQYVISCDEDDRINFGVDLEYIHQIQNFYFLFTNNELT